MYEILKTVYPKMMIGFYLTLGIGIFYQSDSKENMLNKDKNFFFVVSDTQM